MNRQEELLRQLQLEAEQVRETIDAPTEEEHHEEEEQEEEEGGENDWEDDYYPDENEEQDEEITDPEFEDEGEQIEAQDAIPLTQYLEEEAKKLQASISPVPIAVVPPKPAEQTLYEVYDEAGRKKMVPLMERQSYYIVCQDGTYVWRGRQVDINGKNYNRFSDHKVMADRYNFYYVIDDPTTYGKFYPLKKVNGEVTVNMESGGTILSLRSLKTSTFVYIESLDAFVIKSELDNSGYEVRNKELKKKRTEQEFKEYLFESVPFFKKVADSIYQENWDIAYNERAGKFCFIVKFDEFTITNSRGSTHIIKELYVALPFVTNNDRITIHGIMYGGRGLMSTQEYHAGYSHSHLPSGFGTFDSFCLGSGPISSMIIDFNRNSTEQNLFSVLYNIRIYVEWESIEGTPHKNMTSVGKREDSSINAYDSVSFNYNAVLNKYIKVYKLPLKIKNVSGEVVFELDEQEIEKQLVEFVEPHCLFYKNEVTGRYYRANNVPETERSSKTPILKFKGQPVCPRTYNVVKENENKDKQYVIHPSIRKQFIDTTVRRIRDYYVEKNTGFVKGKGEIIHL
jgi:hypothetical protein